LFRPAFGSDCDKEVEKWFLLNGLLLNLSKTEAIVFGTQQKLHTFNHPPGLDQSGVVIDLVDKIKILDVTLDSSLSLEKHVMNTVSSCNYHIRALRHIRGSLTFDAAVMNVITPAALLL